MVEAPSGDFFPVVRCENAEAILQKTPDDELFAHQIDSRTGKSRVTVFRPDGSQSRTWAARNKCMTDIVVYGNEVFLIPKQATPFMEVYHRDGTVPRTVYIFGYKKKPD